MKNQRRIGLGTIIASLMILAACEQQGPAEPAGEKIDEAVEESRNSFEDAVEQAGEKLEAAGDEIREQTQ